MKSMLLYIPEGLHRKLKDYAEEKKLSMTTVVIKALSNFLEKESMREEEKENDSECRERKENDTVYNAV